MGVLDEPSLSCPDDALTQLRESSSGTYIVGDGRVCHVIQSKGSLLGLENVYNLELALLFLVNEDY